jgi:hypothetical protein
MRFASGLIAVPVRTWAAVLWVWVVTGGRVVLAEPNSVGIWGGNISVCPFDEVDFPAGVVRWLSGLP